MKSTPFLNRTFQLASVTALLGWIALFLFPSWTLSNLNIMAGLVSFLCVIYLLTLVLGGRFDEPGTAPKGHFRSMRGVLKLFQSPRAVLVGWVHFLAFDLMVGLFILYDANAQGIGFVWIVPCLFLTLMLGPIGLLSYFALRLFML